MSALSGNDLFTLVQNINDRLRAIEETGIIPVGLIAHCPGPVPNGWLLCDGSALDANRYGALRVYLKALVVPDLRGRVVVGQNAATFPTLLGTGGAETVTLTGAQSGQPAVSTGTESALHTHPSPGGLLYGYTINPPTAQAAGGATFAAINGFDGGSGTESALHTHSISAANAASSHTNLQPYIVLSPIIKF